MSDIKVNETIENEIIELFEENIVKPVIDKLDSKADIQSAKTELSKNLSEIKTSVNNVDESVKKSKESACENKDELALKIATAAQESTTQNNEISRIIECKSEMLMELLDDLRKEKIKADKIKYGLIASLGGISIILEILILVLK